MACVNYRTAWHGKGMGTAWAQHAMCESALSVCKCPSEEAEFLTQPCSYISLNGLHIHNFNHRSILKADNNEEWFDYHDRKRVTTHAMVEILIRNRATGSSPT
jgi:hypothetical protein